MFVVVRVVGVGVEEVEGVGEGGGGEGGGEEEDEGWCCCCCWEIHFVWGRFCGENMLG